MRLWPGNRRFKKDTERAFVIELGVVERVQKGFYTKRVSIKKKLAMKFTTQHDLY